MITCFGWVWVSALAVSSIAQGQEFPPFGAESRPESPALQNDRNRPAFPPPQLGGGASTESRDPTAPPESLLDRIPKPEPPIEPLPRTVKPRQTRQVAAIAPLPELPKIVLRGIVLSTPQRGRAMLNVDGTSIAITLLPRDQQVRMPIPPMQFAHLKAALDRRAALNAPDETGVPTKPNYEMCLQCSFTSEGTVFNVEAFTAEAVVLRAVPHDTLILVRRSSHQR
ncbi:MAG: hypothetical protein AAFX06_25885 [Planctomycetota bacterium]